MTLTAMIHPDALLFERKAYDRPVDFRLFLCRIFNALLGSALATMLFCAAYLCKCKMGIDLFAGPSFLHDPLYWIVSAKA